MDQAKSAQELLEFIAACPSMFHTAATIRAALDKAGFSYLPEHEVWSVEPGGSYYTVRNGSSVVAFRVGEHLDSYHFQIGAAHADSPTFKVKAVPELVGPGEYLRLNVEGYGGMIDYTWFDRPLSVAGRVLVGSDSEVSARLLNVSRPVVLIPSLAIHMNREVNQGLATNHQVDLCPLFSAGALRRGAFEQLLAEELGVTEEEVLSFDLYLVNRQPGVVWGAAQEFVSTPKLDDLQCAFSALRGFLSSNNEHDVSVFACFDSEEIGSGTKQGAKSTLLRDVLRRVNIALGKSEEDFLRALAASFMVSCDNAHAIHPNHPEHADEENRPVLNGGVVIKEHAKQLYTTDAFSRAAFLAICRDAGVPTQVFANRSDKRSGSTLGNLATAQVSIHTLDVGLPQLAMHSAYETGGTQDTFWGIQALRSFFDCDLHIDEARSISLG
ncbi:MAG: M18 family aminopeptidase [Atopobiaceae bacterium]|nr:M18 family aminopeptidase [Atopobiaceae bacterium]